MQQHVFWDLHDIAVIVKLLNYTYFAFMSVIWPTKCIRYLVDQIVDLDFAYFDPPPVQTGQTDGLLCRMQTCHLASATETFLLSVGVYSKFFWQLNEMFTLASVNDNNNMFVCQ